MVSAPAPYRLATVLLVAALALAGAPRAAAAADATAFEFEGVIEPMQKVTIASHLNGIVDEVLFAPGDTIAAGDPLFRIDPKEFEIAVAAAHAQVAEAEARLELATAAAARQARLLDSGSGSGVRASEAEVERRVAEARLNAARAVLEAAELALDRTLINAPIAGRIGWPLVARGAFVEAEAGTPMAEIVQTDPVLVAYRVAYEARTAAMVGTDSRSVAELFGRLTVDIVLASGARHDHPGRPRFESAAIDPATGTLTAWAEVPNPDGTLVPGLPVTVLSRASDGEGSE